MVRAIANYSHLAVPTPFYFLSLLIYSPILASSTGFILAFTLHNDHSDSSYPSLWLRENAVVQR